MFLGGSEKHIVPHTTENEPSGFKSKHLIFFSEYINMQASSYNLNFQKMPPRAFLGNQFQRNCRNEVHF